MLQEQNTMQNRDLNNLSARNQELIDKFGRADLQCGQLTAELLTANAAIDQLRNETANLRAEKKIWEVRIYASGLRSAASYVFTSRMYNLASLKITRRWPSSGGILQTS